MIATFGERCVLQTCLPEDEPDADADDADLDTGDAGDTGDTGDADTPEPDAPDSGDPPHPVALSLSSTYSCALLSDATVWCWGSTQSQVMGHQDDQEAPTPVKVQGLDGAMQVVAAYEKMCALLWDGSVKCLGEGATYGLGDGTQEDSAVPVEVISEKASLLDAGTSHFCAVFEPDQSLKCWGWNEYGQAGAGADPTLMPALVEGVAGVTQLALGDDHTCVLTDAGEVICFGDNDYFQTGVEGEEGGGPTPTTHDFFSTANPPLEIVSGATHACALMSNDGVQCWGDNEFGQLGQPENSPENSATPFALNTTETLSGLAAGSETTCGIGSGGRVFCWGPGNGDEPSVVAQVAGLSDVKELAMGLDHFCALTHTHEIYCWGTNAFGQLGKGSVAQGEDPVGEPVVATWTQ